MVWRPRKKKGSEQKYGNTEVHQCAYGFSHRSKLEFAVCQIIKLREMAGEIEHLQHEDHTYLTKARIGYIPDFKCRDTKTNEIFWIEAKGYANELWPTKKKLWKHYGHGRLEVWRGTHQRPFLDETIIPVTETREEEKP
jgi:hypothetical protein